MFVCVARLVLQIPESGSLKAKRQILRRVTDRVKARFNAAVAEVEDNDLWQKATLALAVVGNDRRHVDEQMSKIIHFVEEMYVAPLLTREREIIGFGEQLFGVTERGAPLAPRAADVGEALSTEDLIAGLTREDRSLAEAEGLGDWERRHERRSGREQAAAGTQAPSPAPVDSDRVTQDDVRARARSLRNPREWEKK